MAASSGAGVTPAAMRRSTCGSTALACLPEPWLVPAHVLAWRSRGMSRTVGSACRFRSGRRRPGERFGPHSIKPDSFACPPCSPWFCPTHRHGRRIATLPLWSHPQPESRGCADAWSCDPDAPGQPSHQVGATIQPLKSSRRVHGGLDLHPPLPAISTDLRAG